MGGLLKEHLNYVYHCYLNWPESDEHQLDLLFPVKLKKLLIKGRQVAGTNRQPASAASMSIYCSDAVVKLVY